MARTTLGLRWALGLLAAAVAVALFALSLSLSPAAGPLAGATSVTITGAGFAVGATTFKFGSKAATDVQCASSTSCTALAPASKKAGTVQVIATVGKQKSPASLPGDGYDYE
jgi:hypothetical protein